MNSRYLEAKFDYSYFIIFCVMVSRFYTKNLKSFQPKMKAWRQYYRILGVLVRLFNSNRLVWILMMFLYNSIVSSFIIIVYSIRVYVSIMGAVVKHFDNNGSQVYIIRINPFFPHYPDQFNILPHKKPSNHYFWLILGNYSEFWLKWLIFLIFIP